MNNDTTTKFATQSEWLAATKADLRKRDKSEKDFMLRLTGLMAGTCAATVGYIGKATDMMDSKRVTYYACKELVTIFQSWHWHVCYHWEINANVKKQSKKWEAYKPIHTIFVTDSLTKAINFLKLEKHGK